MLTFSNSVFTGYTLLTFASNNHFNMNNNLCHFLFCSLFTEEERHEIRPIKKEEKLRKLV